MLYGDWIWVREHETNRTPCVSEAKPVTRTDVARVIESSSLSGHPIT